MSRPRFFLLFPTLLTSLFGSCQRYEDLSADTFLSRLGTEPDAQLVDVRTPEEFAAGHLPGARNIDCLADGFLDEAQAALDAGRPVMVYCRTGKRSADASKRLASAGFRVLNLLGGYAGWSDAGLPVLSAADDQVEAEYAGTLLTPGTPAPDFRLNDIDGNPVSLSDFRGQSVVLVFWASWCPDCRAEVPDLKKMAAEADPARVRFVSVSFDREFDALVKFAAGQELPGVQLFEPAGKAGSAVGAAFGVRWIPSLYLIGPDGNVVFGTVLAPKIAAALRAYPTRLLAPGAAASADTSASNASAAAGSAATRQPCDDESCAL